MEFSVEPLPVVEVNYYTFMYGPDDTVIYEVIPSNGDLVHEYHDRWTFKFAPRKSMTDPKVMTPGGDCSVWKPVRISAKQTKMVEQVVDEQREYLKELIQAEASKSQAKS